MKKIYLPFLLIFSACGGGQMRYDATGIFETTDVMVSAEVGGKLLQFSVAEGQRVDSGATLGCVDTMQLHLQRLQLEAKIKATQSRHVDVGTQLAVVEQQLGKAQTELRRCENLLRDNAATQKQVDDMAAQVALLERQLAAQRTSLTSANISVGDEATALRAQCAQVCDQLRRCALVSPIAGTVLGKYAEVGEVVGAGRPLCKLADIDRIVLRAYVGADQLTQIKVGQEVQVFADFGETEMRAYKGRVAWVADKAEFTPKTIQTRDERTNLVYAVKIAVANDGYIKRGMYGNLLINR